MSAFAFHERLLLLQNAEEVPAVPQTGQLILESHPLIPPDQLMQGHKHAEMPRQNSEKVDVSRGKTPGRFDRKDAEAPVIEPDRRVQLRNGVKP